MADARKPGFEIDHVYYPFPDAFRLGDTVLVQELLPAPLTFLDFTEALDDEAQRKNPVFLIPLVAVAIWQRHKTWKRDKVVKYVEQINFESFESVAGDDEPEEDEARPPDESSTESQPKSNELPEQT